MRLYADRFPADVAGLVLVDPAHENARLFSIPRGAWVRLREQDDDYMSAAMQKLYDARRANRATLGSRPLVIIWSSRLDPPPAGTSTELWSELKEEKRAEKVDLATLSSNAKLVWDPSSGHEIQVDNPSLVAEIIADVVLKAGR